MGILRKMKNKKIHNAMMKSAMLFADLSYAKRLKVGAILSKDKRIIACGYNGTLPKSDNTCEVNNITCETVIHAEQNILSFCAKNGIRTNNTILYVTTSPCIECAKLIISAGIKKVYYLEKYRNINGLNLLKDNNIKCKQLKDI